MKDKGKGERERETSDVTHIEAYDEACIKGFFALQSMKHGKG